MRPVYNDGVCRLLLAVALLVSVQSSRAAAPVVLVVVIDGLGASAATPDRLPRLAERARDPSASWTSARGVLPARTNPSHASLLTGHWPDGHGIVGNRYWDVTRRMRVSTGDPRLLEAETLFEVIARERPDLRTGAFFAKPKLRQLLGGVPGSVPGPDVLWTAGAGYARDDVVLGAVGGALVSRDAPRFVVASIGDVDAAAHRKGPDAPVVADTIARADRLLDELLARLIARGLWERAVVVVTSDHGFAPVRADGVIRLPAGEEDGVVWVDEGPVAFGYPVVPGAAVSAPTALLAHPGVAGVRVDLAALGLGHPRAGAFMLRARAGSTFALGSGYAMAGDHGGEEERTLPLIVVGGHRSLRRLPTDVSADLVDLAPTVAAMLGVRSPRTRRNVAVRSGAPLPIWAPAAGGSDQAPQCRKNRSKTSRAGAVIASTRAAASAARASGSTPASET